MRPCLSVASAAFVLAALLVFAVPSASRAEVPLVVAVDTSRSLDAAALERVVDRLRLALQGLPAETPSGLLAFDDEPRWQVELGASPAEVASALSGLTLQGNFTLLNDALFVAARALPEGGVVLLATDGRDENSAVLVDDIARRSEEQDVRIVAVGTGRTVRERALRRLALVTNGAYLGGVSDVDASALANEVKTGLEEVAELRTSRRATQAPAASVPPQGPPRAAEGPPGTGGESTPVGPSTPADLGGSGSVGALWQSPYLLAGLLGLLLLFGLLAFGRRRGKEAEADDDSERERERLDQQAADEAEAGMVRLELAQAEAAQPQEAPEVTVDTTVLEQLSLDERLERTRVLQDHSMLVMRKLGERPRTFMLDSEKAFAVGRDRHKNTLAVPDPALSSQHFKVVPRGEAQFFVDLESTNGSYVNGRRVAAKRLRHGDMIRAGQVEFEYQSYSNV
ncbi:MAG: FHA domain-containing protein [Holophagales bacterium]|nr:FHA domain-containing protein [Holophagales bacterium]